VRNGIASSLNFFRLRQKSSHDPLGARPSAGAYIQGDIHQPLTPGHDAQQGQMRSTMPMLFWLPLIFHECAIRNGSFAYQKRAETNPA
jgi:hypothetical protein